MFSSVFGWLRTFAFAGSVAVAYVARCCYVQFVCLRSRLVDVWLVRLVYTLRTLRLVTFVARSRLRSWLRWLRLVCGFTTFVTLRRLVGRLRWLVVVGCYVYGYVYVTVTFSSGCLVGYPRYTRLVAFTFTFGLLVDVGWLRLSSFVYDVLVGLGPGVLPRTLTYLRAPPVTLPSAFAFCPYPLYLLTQFCQLVTFPGLPQLLPFCRLVLSCYCPQLRLPPRPVGCFYPVPYPSSRFCLTAHPRGSFCVCCPVRSVPVVTFTFLLYLTFALPLIAQVDYAVAVTFTLPLRLPFRLVCLCGLRLVTLRLHPLQFLVYSFIQHV